MGFLTPDPADEEDESGPDQGLELDLRPMACPTCRRELLPWQSHCPDDGSAAVPAEHLGPAGGPEVPDHLRPDGPDGDDGPAGDDGDDRDDRGGDAGGDEGTDASDDTGGG